MKKNKIRIFVASSALLIIAASAACTKSVSTEKLSNGNSGNSIYASTSNSSPAVSNKEDVADKDTTPLTMSISEFLASNDSEKVGRIVTVTGGQLDAIAYDSLLIRDGPGYAFHCYGSFSDYMSMSTQIDSLRQRGRAPGATVKGAYKMSSYGSPELGPCVLVDLKK